MAINCRIIYKSGRISDIFCKSGSEPQYNGKMITFIGEYGDSITVNQDMLIGFIFNYYSNDHFNLMKDMQAEANNENS